MSGGWGVGFWFERFNIIVNSLQRDYNPQVWGSYTPTIIETGITLGSFGFFFTLFALFVRSIPAMSIAELKENLEAPRKNPAQQH